MHRYFQAQLYREKRRQTSEWSTVRCALKYQNLNIIINCKHALYRGQQGKQVNGPPSGVP